MASKPPQQRKPWQGTPEEARRKFDRDRGSSAARGYDAIWQKLRLAALNDEPLCRYCAREGRVTPATVVDHIIPIADRPDLRLDIGNLQSLCAPCHNGVKQREDRARLGGALGNTRTRQGVP